MIVDAHCHLDAYQAPLTMAQDIDRRRILTVAVTNSPTDFVRAYPHVRSFRSIHLALGLHPLLGDQHPAERRMFGRFFASTSYVGEVGLDFSPEGAPSRVEQEESFRHVLNHLRGSPKFVTVHSRRAEDAVLDLLEEFEVGPVVFHWFSGPLRTLDRLLAAGHACSVNPAMIASVRGRAVIDHLPPERVFTETDGPFVAIAGRPAQPGEVGHVLNYLSLVWDASPEEVAWRIAQSLRAFIPSARTV